jgi:hypothetical protein
MLPFLKEKQHEQIWVWVVDGDFAEAAESRHISTAERIRLLPFLKERQY